MATKPLSRPTRLVSISTGDEGKARMSPVRLPPPLPKLMPNNEPAIEWREYARIEAGTYPACCKWAKRYRDLAFQRWTCLVIWDVLEDYLLTVIATIPYREQGSALFFGDLRPEPGCLC
jgi:hypothetical protein